jgi:hypothetical protein
MTRSIIALAAVTMFGAAACQGSASDTQDQANAQAKATTEISNAQVNANKTVAKSQADLATTREDYRHMVQANLDSVDKKIATLDAKAKGVAVANAADLTAKTTALRAQRNALANDLATSDTVNISAWDATKARLDKEWTDLSVAVEKAM